MRLAKNMLPAFLAAALFGAAPRAEDAGPDAAKAATDSANHHEFIAKMQRELDTVGIRIDTLKARSARASEKSKAELKRKIIALDERRDKLIAKLDSLGHSGASKWDDLKAGTQREVDSLKQAVNKLKRKFKSK